MSIGSFYRRLKLRTKIALAFAGVILCTGLIAALTGINLIAKGTLKETQNRVRLDLNSAHEIFRSKMENIETVLKYTSIRSQLKEGLFKSDKGQLAEILSQVRETGKLEILNVTDEKGNVVFRSSNPQIFGDSMAHNPLVERVLKNAEVVSSVEIVSLEDLKKEGGGLEERAKIPVIDTPLAKPAGNKELNSGMMVLSAMPIKSSNRLIGVIYGGRLLNNNFELVDKIKDIVYRNQKYQKRDVGTVTIFQEDIRISTNVYNSDGSRAIGTRVSDVVRKKVLIEGKNWIDEAFVVNEWYITAYEPIKNLAGDIIGSLYVGTLKKPYSDNTWRIFNIFLGITFLGLVIVFFMANFVAGRISRPLREMRDKAKKIAAGDYSLDIFVKSEDVVGELADAFNKMTKKLLDHQRELENWVKTLEDKVEDRTKEIKGMQQELIQIEKMASVGRLAAGVAHEINNPLTGILTNASLLLEDFPEGNPNHEDIKTIVNETMRCRKIVKDLLDFSRQTKPEKIEMDINGIIDATCDLVRNQISFKSIEIRRDLDSGVPKVLSDKDQMTQVFINILLNAADAMPKGGDILVSSKYNPEGTVEVSIKDSGVGIDPEDAKHMFDPFFSTKPHGTGLGLAISYGIVQQHGGTIKVISEKGKGAEFKVILPLKSGA